MKKDMKEEKGMLQADWKNNTEVEKLVQQNTEIKELIALLENRLRRNNLKFMSIKEKVGKKVKQRKKWDKA